MLSSAGPYSINLMTRVLSRAGPPPTHYNPSNEEPLPSWEEEVYGQPLTSEQSILSDVVNTYVHPSILVASRLCSTSTSLDRQPVGWLPPLCPSLHPNVDQNLPPTTPTHTSLARCSTPQRNNTPVTPDLPEFDMFDDGYPDIHRGGVDHTNSASTSSTSPSSAFTCSPSPSVSDEEFSVKSVRTVKGNNSLELSPLPALREERRRKIRQGSGVKPKAKAPQTHSRRGSKTAPSSHSSSELVQCQWEGCTQRLYVDYVSVGHWGKHIREHYANQPDSIRCKWGDGCDSVIHKSSMWKHIVVHQPKFKIRCPRGCDVFTRSDMMRRHLQSCTYGSEDGESEQEDGVGVGEGSRAGDRGGDGGDNEGGEED